VQKPPELDSLETVVSAGSPLSPELYQWFYNTFPKHIVLNSGSGGTDLVGGSKCVLILDVPNTEDRQS
jgi:acyl-coenzyme A synthetase/AMP-(fatty) acid ligase